MFRQKVVSKFIPITHSHNSISNSNKSKNKLMKIIKLPPSIPARLPKKILKKLKFFKKEYKSMKKVKPYNKPSYAQALTPKVSDMLKIKENYPSLPAKKIENIHKIINNLYKSKSRINRTTKGPSRKQIIIPMDNNNKTKFITLSSNYIANLNKALKNIKSDVLVYYAYIDQDSIIIVTNKIAFLSDFQIIENYV